MKYRICEDMSITTGPGNELGNTEIDTALLALSGFRPEPVDEHTVWVNSHLRYWVPGEQTQEEMNAISAVLNAHPINPSLDTDFAQRLLRLIPMVIAPVVTHKGKLVGEWYVENNPLPARGDIMSNGHQLHTYQHQLLSVAVAMVFLQTKGIGQQAWIYLGENESAEPEVHYVAPVAENLALLDSAPSFVRSPELDEYAAVGVPPEVLKDAFEIAQLKRIAAS